MSYLDVLKSVVQGGAAARTGYLAGQDQERDKRRTEARQDAAVARQSRLDEIKAALEQSQAAENTAQAHWYRTRDTRPKAVPPHTINTEEGVMQYDTATGKFKPTGFHPPERAAARSADRAAAKDAHQGTKDALSGVERQIGDTRADMKAAESNLDDEPAVIAATVAPMKSRLDSLRHVGDSLNAELKTPGSGARMSAAAGSRVAQLRPAAQPSASPASQADYQRAAAAYQQALHEATSSEEKTLAKTLYDRAVARLAKKHGQMK